jgi:hypothetical protein
MAKFNVDGMAGKKERKRKWGREVVIEMKQYKHLMEKNWQIS